MKIAEFLKHWASLIAVLGLLGIEIAPIKITPIRWLFNKIGSLLNGAIEEKVNNLSDKVDKIEESQDFTDVFSIKQHVTNYHALLLTSGLDENQYRRCFELETKYREYQQKYPGRVNGHMNAMFESIHNNYVNGNIVKLEDKNGK